jgi:hypothetical protein
VKVLVAVVVVGLGVIVFVFLAVAEGTVTVVNGPVVETMVWVEVTDDVMTGVVVIVNDTVGVDVIVCCGPTSSTRSDQVRRLDSGMARNAGTSLPCKWVSIIIVSNDDDDPISRFHLVLQNWACRQLWSVSRSGRDLTTQVFIAIGIDKEDVCNVFIATLER